MKLLSYTPQVPRNTINAQVEAPAAQAIANIGQMQAQGLGGLTRGLGVGIGVLQKMAEEKETTNVTAAQTEYAKRVSDMLYNEENGLMNRQLGNADGVSLAYQDGERKIRQDIQKEFKLTGRGLNAFNVACNRDAAGHWGRLNQYEFNEGQKNKKLVTDNALIQISNEAQTLYNDVNSMNSALGKMRATIDANYFNMGKDYCDAYFRQSAANLVTSSLNVAVRKNDMAGAETIMSKFGYLVPPSQLSTYAKAVREYIKENRAIANTQNLYQKFGNNIRGAFAEIDKEVGRTGGEVVFPEGGSLADQAMAAALHVEARTGIPAAIIYGQWVHESTYKGKAFNSPLARENLNFGGLTQVEPNGEENRQRDGGTNYYKMYKSVREFADDYVDSFLSRYDFTGVTIKTPEDWATFLKKQSYYTGYGDTEEEKIAGYAAGIAAGMKQFNPANVQVISDNIDAQKQKDAYIAYVNKEKHINDITTTALIKQAKDMFIASGQTGDPDAIAQQVAGTDVVLKNTIANELNDMKWHVHEKDMPAYAMNSVINMIKYGQFDSLADMTAFMQQREHRFSSKQIGEAQTLWQQRLNGEGIFKYPQIDSYISAEAQTEKDEQKRMDLKIYLRQAAINFVNSYRHKNHEDPTIEDVRAAINKELIEKKFEYQGIVYRPRDLFGKGIVSAAPATYTDDESGETTPTQVSGMMRVEFADANNKYGKRVVFMPVEQFGEILGQNANNDTGWFGGLFNSNYEPDTLNSGT